MCEIEFHPYPVISMFNRIPVELIRQQLEILVEYFWHYLLFTLSVFIHLLIAFVICSLRALGYFFNFRYTIFDFPNNWTVFSRDIIFILYKILKIRSIVDPVKKIISKYTKNIVLFEKYILPIISTLSLIDYFSF